MVTCAQHDYIEIACLYQISVCLELEHGEFVKGIALDTAYDDQKRHCILINTDNGEQWVPLDSLCAMHAMCKNPHFSEIYFQ